MIYDCFTFFNELDLLEIRLNTLNDIVDKFVLVESTKTFTNKDKPLYFEQNKQRFEKFLHKIEHIIVDDFPRFDITWTYETFQRNAIERGLKNCKDEDIIIISDVDEIPNPQKVLEVKDLPGIKALDMEFYVYYLNCNTGVNWVKGSKILSYKDFLTYFDTHESRYCQYNLEKLNKGTTANKIRLHDETSVHISNGGWHFSALGGAEALKQKFRSYSHIKHTKYLSEDELNKMVQDELLRIKNYQANVIVPINNTFPMFIQENYKKYPDLFLQWDDTNIKNYKKRIRKKFFKEKVIKSLSNLFFSHVKTTNHHEVRILFFKFKMLRTSTLKAEKSKQKAIQSVRNDPAYIEKSANFWDLYMQDDFLEKLSEFSQNLDSDAQKRLKNSMARMLANHIIQNDIYIDETDRLEFDIMDEYEAQNRSDKASTNNTSGFEFVDNDYKYTRFLYELGLPALKNIDKIKDKNFIEISEDSGDSAIVLSQKTTNTLFTINSNPKAVKNIELNKIKNVKFVDNLEKINNIGLIRLNYADATTKELEKLIPLLRAEKPSLLIEMDENFEQIFKIKSLITNVEPNYKFTLYKSNPMNNLGELVLVCEHVAS